MSIKNILSLCILIFAFRGEIIEYGGKAIAEIKNISTVDESDAPSETMLGIVRETDLDDRDYTVRDREILSVFHRELAKNILKVEAGEKSNQVLLDHHADALYNYVLENKLEGDYTDTPDKGGGISKDIRAVWVGVIGEEVGGLTEQNIKDYSEACLAIAWVLDE